MKFCIEIFEVSKKNFRGIFAIQYIPIEDDERVKLYFLIFFKNIFLQPIGFLLLVIGMLVYNDLLIRPFIKEKILKQKETD
jgi:hypothetical protein